MVQFQKNLFSKYFELLTIFFRICCCWAELKIERVALWNINWSCWNPGNRVWNYVVQAMSPDEAFKALLPRDVLSISSHEQSITAQIFENALASIYYDCSNAWDKAKFWTKLADRVNDEKFCSMQVVRLPLSSLMITLSLAICVFSAWYKSWTYLSGSFLTIKIYVYGSLRKGAQCLPITRLWAQSSPTPNFTSFYAPTPTRRERRLAMTSLLDSFSTRSVRVQSKKSVLCMSVLCAYAE